MRCWVRGLLGGVPVRAVAQSWMVWSQAGEDGVEGGADAAGGVVRRSGSRSTAYRAAASISAAQRACSLSQTPTSIEWQPDPLPAQGGPGFESGLAQDAGCEPVYCTVGFNFAALAVGNASRRPCSPGPAVSGGPGNANRGRVAGPRGDGTGARRCVQGGAALWRTGSGCLSDAAASLGVPGDSDRVVGRAGGDGGVEGVVGLNGVAVVTQVVDGLTGASRAVLVRVGEPIHARPSGYRLELFTCEEPVGQLFGHRRRGGGDEAVVGVGAEMEVRGQTGAFLCELSVGRAPCWAVPAWRAGA